MRDLAALIGVLGAVAEVADARSSSLEVVNRKSRSLHARLRPSTIVACPEALCQRVDRASTRRSVGRGGSTGDAWTRGHGGSPRPRPRLPQ